jgi:hypothetical protein
MRQRSAKLKNKEIEKQGTKTMSGRFVGIISMAVVALAAALTADAAQADRLKFGTTVIVKCTYLNDPNEPGFKSLVAGIEVAGPRASRIQIHTSCSDMFNTLMNAGFNLVHSVPSAADYDGDGVVDVNDY